jgi:hypothetical protein
MSVAVCRISDLNKTKTKIVLVRLGRGIVTNSTLKQGFEAGFGAVLEVVVPLIHGKRAFRLDARTPRIALGCGYAYGFGFCAPPTAGTSDETPTLASAARGASGSYASSPSVADAATTVPSRRTRTTGT